MWAKVGIRAKVAMMEMGGAPAHGQRHGRCRRGACSWSTRSPPCSTPMEACGASSIRMGSAASTGREAQPGQRFHDLMEQARYLLDPKKRQAIYTEAMAIIDEEKPWLELFQEVVVVRYQPKRGRRSAPRRTSASSSRKDPEWPLPPSWGPKGAGRRRRQKWPAANGAQVGRARKRRRGPASRRFVRGARAPARQPGRPRLRRQRDARREA